METSIWPCGHLVPIFEVKTGDKEISIQIGKARNCGMAKGSSKSGQSNWCRIFRQESHLLQDFRLSMTIVQVMCKLRTLQLLKVTQHLTFFTIFFWCQELFTQFVPQGMLQESQSASCGPSGAIHKFHQLADERRGGHHLLLFFLKRHDKANMLRQEGFGMFLEKHHLQTHLLGVLRFI